MKIILTIFHDMYPSDLEHHYRLADALESYGDVEHRDYPLAFRSREQQSRFWTTHDLDTPCDVHVIGQVYQSNPWDIPIENAKKVWYYQQGDSPLSYPGPSIQNMLWHPEVELEAFGRTGVVTIHAPYGCLPHTLEAIDEAEDTVRDIDVLWIGNERQIMGASHIPRKPWLDEFEALYGPGFMRTGGKSPYDFARLLKRTRTAIVLRGCADDSFRMYEAMRAGCCLVAQPMQRVLLFGGDPDGVTWAETPLEASREARRLVQTGEWADEARKSAQWHTDHYSDEALTHWATATAERIVNEG